MSRLPLSLVVGFQRSPAEPDENRVRRDLAEAVARDVSRQLGQPRRVADVRATRTGSLVVRLQGGDEALIAKLPLKATTEPRLRRSARALQGLHQSPWITPFLGERCPRIVVSGTIDGSYYSTETAVSGQDGVAILKSRAGVLELLYAAERFILKLQKASGYHAAAADGPGWEDEFDAGVDRVAGLADQVHEGPRYRRLVADIRERLAGYQVPSVYTHGNFWLGNALFDTDNNLTGVIDWDCAAEDALPALDLLYFIIRTHSLVRGVSFGEAVANWVDAPSLPLLDACLARHCQELGIPPDLIVALSYSCWITHLDSHCRFGTTTCTNPRWLARNVRAVLRRWRPRADAGPFGTRRWSDRGGH